MKRKLDDPESRPGGQEAADEDELADVVGVVVGEEERFVEERLVVGVRNRGEEIRGGIFDSGGEFFQVGAESGDAFVPGFCIGRFGRFGPVAGREIGRGVLGVKGVFDDVPLCNTEMLEEFPG